MNNDLINTILNGAFTLHQVNARVRALHDYLNSKYYSQGESLVDQSSEESAWLKSLPEPFYAQFNKESLAEVIKQTDEEIKKIPVLVVYLAVDLPKPEIERLGEWIKINYPQVRLFEVKFDPNLIAGVALVWNGVYKDFSLRSKILEAQPEILESFKETLRMS